LAARQHGVIGRAQCAELGLKSREFPRLAASGWATVTERVVHRLGAPATTGSRFIAHVLDAGGDAALSHSAAAHWWGLPGHAAELPSVVTTNRSRRRSPLGTTHIVRELPDEWVTH